MLGDHGEAGDDLVDLGHGDGLGPRGTVGQATAEGAQTGSREYIDDLAAVVVDLGEDRDVVAVDASVIGRYPGDHLAVETVDELLVGPVGRVGRCSSVMIDQHHRRRAPS